MSRRKQPVRATTRVRPVLSAGFILVALVLFLAVRTGLIERGSVGPTAVATTTSVGTADTGLAGGNGAGASPLPVAQATGTNIPAPDTSTAAPAAPAAVATTSSQAEPPAPTANAPPTSVRASDLPTVDYASLPSEAHDTIALIDQGGPFPFERDGITFENRERLLPLHPQGYYREYTVITPGVRTRGARRIVAGQGGELYYTEDHYDSFREIVR